MPEFPHNLAIDRIETTVFRLPMRGTLRWGKHSSMEEARHVLVKVTLCNGAEGFAEAPPRPTIYGETVDSVVAIIRDELTPRVVGIPLPHVQERLQQVRNNHTARGAVDMALHDAVAHSLGTTLAAHLDAPRERVRVSYILGIGTRDEVLEDAIGVVEQGVRVLKVKVGRDWAGDIAQIDLLHTQLPADVQMYADANECMAFDDAPARLAVLRERGLLYCEEPLPVERILERSALRSMGVLPLLGDDSAFTLRDLERELALDTFDILNIKTARTGYTESLAMMQRAVVRAKGIMVGSQASAGLGTARAAVLAARTEVEHPSELSFPLKLRADIVAQPLVLRDGWLTIADALAVTVDPDLLREMAV